MSVGGGCSLKPLNIHSSLPCVHNPKYILLHSSASALPNKHPLKCFAKLMPSESDSPNSIQHLVVSILFVFI